MNPEDYKTPVDKIDFTEGDNQSPEVLGVNDEKDSDSENRDKLASAALHESGVEIMVEKNRNHFGYSIISYFESRKIMRCLNEYGTFIEKNDLLRLENPEKTDSVGEVYNLIQVKNAIADRINSHTEASYEDRASNKDLKKYKHYIKTKYYVGFNRKIAEFIESVNDNNNNFAELRKNLDDELRLASTKTMNSNNELSGVKLSYEKAPMRDIYNIVNGMRHEAAFKELISEIVDGTLDYEESNPEQDSLGFDVILRAKISNELDLNGLFKYASETEILEGDYKIKCLPVDIKSSENTAKVVLCNLLKRSTTDHWAMWSKVHPEDFRLYLNSCGNPEVEKDKNMTSLFLSHELQIKAMRAIKDVTYYGKYGSFTPDPLDKRLEIIKQETLDALNHLYNKRCK